MRKKSFFRKGLEKVILTASGLLLLNSINAAQTTNLTFSGEVKTKTEMERPLQVPINIEQLVSGSWQSRTNTMSNEQGQYEISTIVTGMKEHQALAPMNYIILDNKGFLSATDNTQLTHAVYTVPLMQEILKEQIDLKQGNNDLPKNNFNRLADSHYFETYSNKHGVISRLISIQNGQITHESVKGNRTIKMPVTNSRNNNDDFEKAQKTQASQVSQNFQDSDSLY
ncbi:hypothetical protein K9L97_03070, partial [Candidatus Woesearchaeota archaeon]|nr:hypothetical protein [Candidatus Woesearchaeota archaeon]